MAVRVYVNNVSTRLTAQLLAGGTTANVTAGEGALFAAANGSDWIIGTLRRMSGYKCVAYEIVKITNRSTDALTITRAQESTSALQFEIGDWLDVDFTKDSFTNLYGTNGNFSGTLGVTGLATLTGGAALGATMSIGYSSSNSVNFTITNSYAGSSSWVTYVSGGGPSANGNYGLYNGADRFNITPAGAATFTGTLKSAGAFGCNGQAVQTAYASGGALAAYGAGANGFDSGANASALHAMVVKLRACLVANGIMS